jgi:hypothetical protein
MPRYCSHFQEADINKDEIEFVVVEVLNDIQTLRLYEIILLEVVQPHRINRRAIDHIVEEENLVVVPKVVKKRWSCGATLEHCSGRVQILAPPIPCKFVSKIHSHHVLRGLEGKESVPKVVVFGVVWEEIGEHGAQTVPELDIFAWEGVSLEDAQWLNKCQNIDRCCGTQVIKYHSRCEVGWEETLVLSCSSLSLFILFSNPQFFVVLVNLVVLDTWRY